MSSSSEDDFMSDKYLQAAETTSGTKTYAQRRQEAHKRHLEAQPKSRKVREEEARRRALETSLFDIHGKDAVVSVAGGASANGSGTTTTGAGKAMGMMMKMGWKVGEGLGKKAVDPSSSSSASQATTRNGTTVDPATDDETPNPGIGSNKKRKLSPSLDLPTSTSTAAAAATTTSTATTTHRAAKPRTEPIRISMWAGKLGVGAHQRSPTPEDMSFLLGQGQVGGKGLSKEAMARLDSEADEFRRRRAGKEEGRRVEGMQWKARGLLKQFDEENGIKFHPLWTIPSAPETTIPRPLLRLIDPTTAHHLDLLDDGNPASEQQAQARVQGRADEENMDEAGRLREQMRRDALVELDADDEANDAQEAPARPGKGKVSGSVDAHDNAELDDEQVDWESFVPGVQRVLAMSPSEHLTYLVSSLRADHLYCFWCAARYESVQEMQGPGGCPGEEEEDH